MPEPYYIDIFAGCGGLSTGLCHAGFRGLFAIEKNEEAFSTLKHNLIDCSYHFSWPTWLPVEACDIIELLKNNAEQLVQLRENVVLVAGGPPCQGFSMAGKRNQRDSRNQLIKSYVGFIKLVLPEAIIFENVHGFTMNFINKKQKTKNYSSHVERELRKAGYKISSKIIDMSEYGVPQVRKRFILVAMRNHSPEKVFNQLEQQRESFFSSKKLIAKTTVFDAIDDLKKGHGTVPSPDSKGFQAGQYGPQGSAYQKFMRNKLSKQTKIADSHRFVNHRPTTIKLHEELLANAPRGKRLAPGDVGAANLNRRGVTVLDPNGLAPTLTSIPDEMIHYSEPRILTVREHARLQSFPDWFHFKGKYTSGGQRRKQEVPRYTQIGNAVPPLFAEQIGKALLEVLNENEQ